MRNYISFPLWLVAMNCLIGCATSKPPPFPKKQRRVTLWSLVVLLLFLITSANHTVCAQNVLQFGQDWGRHPSMRDVHLRGNVVIKTEGNAETLFVKPASNPEMK